MTACEWQVQLVSGGRFLTDGGAMFGVVPKSLWSRTIDVDDQNRIQQDTCCLLVRGGGRVILVDTGYGGKLSEKQRAWMGAETGAPLLRSLARHGVAPTDVTDVVFSHLHYDHCGGASILPDESDVASPAFPNATHHVQALEWEIAHDDSPELKGAYPRENLTPLADVRWQFADGESDLWPGFRVVPSPGHTMGHQSIVISTERETIAYLGDLVPTSRHFPTLWCMAYDVHLLATRRSKLQLLGQAADHGWTVVLNHDPDRPTARVQRDQRKGFRIAE
ncbi:MAG: MBL fold metallo-hydrolase [Planctomycetales bacterium]|nr:MBL fold metallo-hydrolase [Planctomycetales bacterium]